ncbi:unnamed protein product [Mesocestoides corti]|uniref:Secreted protein n=1 Tax=Mesocestoides corti TaxID=53468 RepID=A0A0R3UAA7_MESCO|nr:unnamed protein product [Mesocestoides corti]
MVLQRDGRSNAHECVFVVVLESAFLRPVIAILREAFAVLQLHNPAPLLVLASLDNVVFICMMEHVAVKTKSFKTRIARLWLSVMSEPHSASSTTIERVKTPSPILNSAF